MKILNRNHFITLGTYSEPPRSQLPDQNIWNNQACICCNMDRIAASDANWMTWTVIQDYREYFEN